HHQRLAVVIADRRKIQAHLGVAIERPGGISRKQVHFARLQRREAILGGQWSELHLLRIVENSRGERTAEIDVKPSPVALIIRAREASDALADAALDETLLLDLIEGRGGRGRSRTEHHYGNEC